jgi:hypothetical protein
MTNEASVDHGDRLDYLERLAAERDRRYEERFHAVEKLVASELRALVDSRSAMIDSFKAAVAKTEQAQNAWNTQHNDLVRKMEDQYQHMMPREEALGKFDDIKQAIADLRESRSESHGKSGGLNAGWAYLMGGVILVATLVHLFLSLVQK